MCYQIRHWIFWQVFLCASSVSQVLLSFSMPFSSRKAYLFLWFLYEMHCSLHIWVWLTFTLLWKLYTMLATQLILWSIWNPKKFLFNMVKIVAICIHKWSTRTKYYMASHLFCICFIKALFCKRDCFDMVYYNYLMWFHQRGYEEELPVGVMVCIKLQL